MQYSQAANATAQTELLTPCFPFVLRLFIDTSGVEFDTHSKMVMSQGGTFERMKEKVLLGFLFYLSCPEIEDLKFGILKAHNKDRVTDFNVFLFSILCFLHCGVVSLLHFYLHPTSFQASRLYYLDSGLLIMMVHTKTEDAKV